MHVFTGEELISYTELVEQIKFLESIGVPDILKTPLGISLKALNARTDIKPSIWKDKLRAQKKRQSIEYAKLVNDIAKRNASQDEQRKDVIDVEYIHVLKI